MTVPSASGSRCFIDSNSWLYAFIVEQDRTKAAQAAALIQGEQEIVISTQIINEVSINLIRKAQFTEENVRKLIVTFYHRYQVVEIGQAVLLQASNLRQAHRLAFWDSLIVASALAAGASRIYSEDLHDGMVFASQATVVNPFK